MTTETGRLNQDEALRSALDRLPVAVLVVDHLHLLRPMNRRGAALFEAEGLANDLLQARPSHPLSQLLNGIVERPSAELFDERTIRFPSGQRYSVEPSRRSDKGRGRWIMLLIGAVKADAVADETLLDAWALTLRERTLAQLLMHGLSNRQIATELGVSTETVKSHVAGVLHKTDSRSRADFLSKLLRSR